MADGLGNLNPISGLGANKILYSGSFQCNGTSNPVSTTFQASPGFIFTVVYAATGLYTVTLDASLKLPTVPEYLEANPQWAVTATDWFDCGILGGYNTSTGAFVIQAHRSGTGQAPANTANNRINFSMVFRNSTGR